MSHGVVINAKDWTHYPARNSTEWMPSLASMNNNGSTQCEGDITCSVAGLTLVLSMITKKRIGA